MQRRGPDSRKLISWSWATILRRTRGAPQSASRSRALVMFDSLMAQPKPSSAAFASFAVAEFGCNEIAFLR
jgi:hypothetical protein